MPATSMLITNQQMHREREHGRVRDLHPDIPEFCKWYGSWWIQSPDGWLRITDTHLSSRLERVKRRLDIAEDDLACDRARYQDEQPT